MKKILLNNKITKLPLVFLICISFLGNLVYSVKAEGSPPAVPTILNEQQLVSDANIVTWDLLGFGETRLVGPYDAFYFSFNLPADWKLTQGAELNLSLNISVNNGIQSQANSTDTGQGQSTSPEIIGAGSFTIYINQSVFTLPIDQVGEVNKSLQIPVETFTSVNNDGFVYGTIVLNSGLTCNDFNQMTVVIRTSSYFNLPHETVLPSTSLLNFPRPIYQSSFIPDSTLLVIPDQPSNADLQAALTVAAGLNRLSNGSLATDLVTFGKLTDEQKTDNDLIFVGNSSSLPVLGQLQLPLHVVGGKFQVSGGSPEDGIVQLVNSPWNKMNVVLVVSGNTDQGTIKASQAVSTGIFRPNSVQNLAIVQDIQNDSVFTSQPTDQSLASLGYEGRQLENRGINYASYNFDVPPGWALASDAYFELLFGHSALINYDNSGIVVLLNGKPIGSVRMSDTSASISVNKVLIEIPASAVIPGKNRLEVRTNLLPYDLCSPDSMRGLWVNIWPESTLHLPLDLALENPVMNLGLASYPAPFIYYPFLDNTAFVLLRNDLDSWRAALKIASFLGANTNGPITLLKVFYGDEVPEADRSKYNLLVIGRPSEMPFISEINNTLPVPFKDDGIEVLETENFQVMYRISPDSPMGYMEIMPSPWNSDNIILAVLGNTPQGLNWATSALIDPDLRSQLAGNFAAINNKQIITTDTRLSLTVNSISTQTAEVVVVPPIVDTTETQLDGQKAIRWIFPAFIFSIILIVLISTVVGISSWLRNRNRSAAAGKNMTKTE